MSQYLLSLLNSRLFAFTYNLFNPQTGKIFAEIKPSAIKQLPIKLPTPQQEKKIVELVDQMLSLQKKLHEEKPTGKEKEGIERQIKNVDYEIDQEVYKLYGLTKEEIKIVEESLR